MYFFISEKINQTLQSFDSKLTAFQRDACYSLFLQLLNNLENKNKLNNINIIFKNADHESPESRVEINIPNVCYICVFEYELCANFADKAPFYIEDDEEEDHFNVDFFENLSKMICEKL